MVKTSKFRTALKVTILALSVILLLLAAYCMLRIGFGVDVLDRTGWKTRNGIVQYVDYYGTPKTGWHYIDEKLYYFAPENGAMATGWQTVDGDRYYFGTDGVRQTGWQTVDGKTYYLGDTGKMVIGWQVIEGKTYCFTQDGSMARTGWQTVDGKFSYFSDEGTALTGWQMIEGALYYFTSEGYTVSGWLELDNVRFHFEESGKVSTGWFEDETGKFYFDDDGRPHSGWLEYEQKRYYCNEDGTLATGWLTEGADRYYLQSDGTTTVGQIQIDGVSHFFTSKGKWVLMCNPWYAVPEDYVLQMSNVEGYQFASVGRDALAQMMEDCRAAGNSITINNTYRSKATQQWMWDKSVNEFIAKGMTKEEAEKETGKTTAIPGNSEHQTGLAVDLNGPQATYDWLAEHCWEYGFILRYPDDKIDITGIIYEPWHFRYVGTELSLEMQELGITLEEYLADLTPEEVPVINTQPVTE